MATRDSITGLTPKQEAFCVEFVKTRDGNATGAYRKCYASKGSPKTMVGSARRMMKYPKIARRIAELRAIASKKQELSIEQVLEEVKRIAFVDPLTIYGADGKVLPMAEIPEETRHAIASLVIKASGETIIKFWEKTQALERLMRFLGMFEKDNAQRFGFLDDLPRHMLKELEECLIELARADAAADLSAGIAGGTAH
jgi:phage terminase small subunit